MICNISKNFSRFLNLVNQKNSGEIFWRGKNSSLTKSKINKHSDKEL